MSKHVTQATWDDVPHLSEQEKKELWETVPPHEREARAKGIPALGSGAIFPIPEEDILVDDFPIQPHMPQAYGLDVGWNRTATVWGAQNRDNGVIYLHSEYYRGQAEPVIHAAAIKARGEWIPGVIDPASRGRSQRDGSQLLQVYSDLGLDLQPAINTREAGLYLVWQLLSVGKLKVFKSLSNWRKEFRFYQRDEEGRVVKRDDHLMDATRYLIISGRDRMKTLPVKREEQVRHYNEKQAATSWMA